MKAKSKKHAAEAGDEAATAAPKMKRKAFEKELYRLQVELTRLQAWAVAEGARVIVVFEGRDTAGKGGVISRIMQRCSPRVFKHVALPAPSDRAEPALHRALPGRQGDYRARPLLVQPGGGRARDGLLQQARSRALPASGARRGARDRQQRHHLAQVLPRPRQDEQRRRFEARIGDPVKHGKLSSMDVESVRRWWDYTRAYQAMLAATDTEAAPWYIVPADDKRRARLNLIRHMLDPIPYRKVEVNLPKIPKPQPPPEGVEDGPRAAHVVPNRY
jgi:hypothetical protein